MVVLMVRIKSYVELSQIRKEKRASTLSNEWRTVHFLSLSLSLPSLSALSSNAHALTSRVTSSQS